jgi:manganese/zinc/iron transport system permease protein
VLSLTLAPERGLAWAALQRRRQSRQIRTDAVLADLYALAKHHEGDHAHAVSVLETMRGGRSDVHRSLAALEDLGLARRDDAGGWLITPEGRTRSEDAGER